MSVHYKVDEKGEITGYVRTADQHDGMFDQLNPGHATQREVVDYKRHWLRKGKLVARQELKADMPRMVDLDSGFPRALLDAMPRGTIVCVVDAAGMPVTTLNYVQMKSFVFEHPGVYRLTFKRFPHLERKLKIEVI